MLGGSILWVLRISHEVARTNPCSQQSSKGEVAQDVVIHAILKYYNVSKDGFFTKSHNEGWIKVEGIDD